jgi:hypothetical protein
LDDTSGVMRIGGRHPPIGMFRHLARLAEPDMIAAVRGVLWAGLVTDPAAARQRVAAHTEDGLAMLSEQVLPGQPGPPISMELVEECRHLADRDPRFRFIYRLPVSAGWGAAIGASLERALFGGSDPGVRATTLLLNVFMTVLDGLLDETPDIVAPHLPALLDLVREGSAGADVSDRAPPHDHPVNRLCFLVAQRWLALRQGLSQAPELAPRRTAFAAAAETSMQVELAVCDLRFDQAAPRALDDLYGRVSWPLWTQAVAALSDHPWPAGADFEAFRRLIFAIGDFAAFLDDVRDYVWDCERGLWNTVSARSAERFLVAAAEAEETEARLLANVADRSFAAFASGIGLELRARIEAALAPLDCDRAPIRDLLADLAYAYLV